MSESALIFSRGIPSPPSYNLPPPFWTKVLPIPSHTKKETNYSKSFFQGEIFGNCPLFTSALMLHRNIILNTKVDWYTSVFTLLNISETNEIEGLKLSSAMRIFKRKRCIKKLLNVLAIKLFAWNFKASDTQNLNF